MRCYSHFFATLHDEQAPVGRLGRGTHCSILRAVLWDTDQPQWHDFAVIWDEDHDWRVIAVIEQLYIHRLLGEVIAIGERKGSITIVTATARPSRALLARSEEGWNAPDGDWFCSRIEHVDVLTGLLINAEPKRVQAYVKGIDALWDLGTKPIPTDKLVGAEHIDANPQPGARAKHADVQDTAVFVSLLNELRTSLRSEQVAQLTKTLDASQKMLFVELMNLVQPIHRSVAGSSSR